MSKLRRLLFAATFPMIGNVAAADFQSLEKPNVLVLYSDDHGWADLGANGADADVRTPNLDALAKDGVRFTRGYVTAPQCVPSRAGVLTGRYQQRFGVEDNNHGPLPLAEVTIAERLKRAGYATGMAGKWHLDLVGKSEVTGTLRSQPDFMPRAQGFDEYWRGEMRSYIASHDLGGRPLPDAPVAVTDNRFRVVVQTDAALAFLDRRKARPAQPWFLYLAWFAPHVPLESPEPWFSKTPAHLPKERRQALAMIAAMDDGVGRLRAKLREMGVETNTLIFFIGDNGAPLGPRWDGSVNLPMRGEKGMLAEGGIRVPFVAAWPGRIPGGQVCEEPVISLDVAATANAAAGLPPAPELDGRDLLPFLTATNRAMPVRTLYWRWMAQATVLEFPYKLIALGGHSNLLFDVTTPEGESYDRNLAEQKPELAARLAEKLQTWTAGLQPPGMPQSLPDHHVGLFAAYGLTPSNAVVAESDALQGWIGRGCSLAVTNGALVVQREAGTPKPFFTRADLDLAGPVTVRLSVRAERGGAATITWRSAATTFAPQQSAAFEWPAADDWREVEVTLPERSRILHVRIVPPTRAVSVAVRSVSFRDDRDRTTTFRFSQYDLRSTIGSP